MERVLERVIMADEPAKSIERSASGKARTGALWVLAIVIIVPACAGFIDKFIQFLHTLEADEEGGGFAIVPIMNYLIVTAGFMCLLIWAIAHGMFRDIERPKYTMLEREAQLDEGTPTAWSEES